VCHENAYTYEQIAELMDIQRRSVENFRASLFDKFKSKTGLVLFAMRWRLMDLG
jgi:two-component system invasion response regulator UvrY